MPDVFISYSSSDRAVAERLAEVLRLRGFDVWWDAALYAGQNFPLAIRQAISQSRAVIVIWSASSAVSNWVLGEASEAGGKLICLRLDGLPLTVVPIPYLPLHCEPVSNHDAIVSAVNNKINGVSDSTRTFDEAAAIRALAQAGHVDAMVVYGRMAEAGEGVEYNPEEAFKFYRMAADKGDGLGQLQLGCLYQRGLGTNKNESEALRLFMLAADQGFVTAQFNAGASYHYGVGTPVEFTHAAYYYLLASRQGDLEATVNLGILYENGTGVPQNFEKAVELYGTAAKQGSAKGLYALALMYGKGRGVAKDDGHAVALMQRSAKLGFKPAKMVLISMGYPET